MQSSCRLKGDKVQLLTLSVNEVNREFYRKREATHEEWHYYPQEGSGAWVAVSMAWGMGSGEWRAREWGVGRGTTTRTSVVVRAVRSTEYRVQSTEYHRLTHRHIPTIHIPTICLPSRADQLCGPRYGG